MRIEQQVRTGRPIDEVWKFLSDIPAVVSCIPGAELDENLGDNRYRGKFNLKVGPLSARIEGEGRVTRDETTHSGSIEGKGVDRRGGSRVGATISFRVTDLPAGAVVDISADLNLAGPLSQIGRTGLIEDVARRLTEDFSKALGRRLVAAPGATAQMPDEAQRIESTSFDAGRALRESLWKRLRAWFVRLFGG